MARLQDKLFLELGAGSFRACILSYNSSGRAEIHLAEVASAGVRRGDIADQVVAGESLDSLLTNIERLGFSEFKSCELVLPGSLTTGRVVTGAVKLHGLSISKDHGDELRDELTTRASDPAVEVVELDIQSWIAAGYQGTDFPTGRSSEVLEATAFCTLVDRQVLGRMVSLCNGAGLEVTATHSSIAAAARLISRLSPEASNRVLLDIGHSSTVGMIMVGHRANATFSVRAGSHHITRDVASALGCSLSDAESLKRTKGLQVTKRFPLALPASTDLDAKSSLDSRPHTQADTRPETDIFPWAAPRVAEIFSLSLRHFAIYAKALDGGITLIGGGSLTSEICSFLTAKLSGVKATRFKPAKESLSAALGVPIYHDDELPLCGFEGLLEVSSASWRVKEQTRKDFSKKAPPFLRPLLSWFTDLAK